MIAHRIETTMVEDGTLVLDHLPFQAGESVEIIILALPKIVKHKRYPLHDVPIQYDDPTEPVALDDWNVLR